MRSRRSWRSSWQQRAWGPRQQPLPEETRHRPRALLSRRPPHGPGRRMALRPWLPAWYARGLQYNSSAEGARVLLCRPSGSAAARRRNVARLRVDPHPSLRRDGGTRTRRGTGTETRRLLTSWQPGAALLRRRQAAGPAQSGTWAWSGIVARSAIAPNAQRLVPAPAAPAAAAGWRTDSAASHVRVQPAVPAVPWFVGLNRAAPDRPQPGVRRRLAHGLASARQAHSACVRSRAMSW